MDNHHVVKLTGLQKRLDDFELGPIDLEFEEGMVYAVVGENGSGKSTLFSLMMNGYKPDAGTVELFGQPYTEANLMIRQRTAFASVRQLWDDYDLNRIDELVAFTSKWYANWDDSLFWGLASELGLEKRQKLRKLSTGMRQRLAIAVALAIKPDLLLLDEATNGLDFRTSRLIHDELVKFMDQQGKTIIFATHILDDIRQLADYIVFIHQGRILGTFEKDVLLGDWKAFWLDQIPSEAKDWPEVVDMDHQGSKLNRLVTSDARVTENRLAELGVKTTNLQALDLQEILIYLVEKKFK
ncbi:ABC transporter ATP-binding protein [Paenibacillus albiflavus]|uniref:ABC transporter ATP-binding protein n=1 Tax=Paenibacillus albiflavus TaxID=2545760 RepID=A0A4V2WP33_9BACL|nr:ABC transporter ATP-binding protein [Paenibacillus albiflavus]TCZ77792.1 ABC transporter ATP-binding protein [Paenibacillus albiflavus]